MRAAANKGFNLKGSIHLNPGIHSDVLQGNGINKCATLPSLVFTLSLLASTEGETVQRDQVSIQRSVDFAKYKKQGTPRP